MALPPRIVLVGSTSQKLSSRFANLRPAPDRYGMDGPRNFLYDDYMESELYGDGPSDNYGTDRSSFRRRAHARGAVDLDLDSYQAVRRQPTGRFRPADDFAPSRPSQNANRFAAAVGIPQRRQQREEVYVDRRPRLQSFQRPQGTSQRRVVRQYVQDYDEPVEEVIKVVRQTRPIRVVKKIPIQQRVKKVFRPGFNNNNNRNANNRQGGPRNQKNVPRRNAGGIQKKKATKVDLDQQLESYMNPKAAQNKTGPKQKATHANLDQELDEYMRSSKHPRINI